MKDHQIPVEDIKKDIKTIQNNGIGVDRKRLLKDMCTQFVDYWEWFREYCVNSSDALATICTILIEDFEDKVRITFEDDGHGMPKEMVLVFMTLFKSVKFGKREKTVGCHGVGKLSVFASDDLTGFAMTTSTGKECWQMKTGSLLDDKPVTINRIEPVPSQGTRFEIEYSKSVSFNQILSKARQILTKYCQYLPLDIVLKGKSYEEKINSEEIIKGSWHYGPEQMPHVYQGEDYSGSYEVILGMNRGVHSVYQNRVLVSNNYNLLSIDGTTGLHLPGLDIRVNSMGFNLNFGRNKLTNESFLRHIASKIRKSLIPKYFNMLAYLYETGGGEELGIGYAKIETLACSILKYDNQWIKSAGELSMFRFKNRSTLSFVELCSEVKRSGKLYLENSESTGVDFSIYDAPVLSLNQPSGGLELLKQYFSDSLINLGLHDVVLEALANSGQKLGPNELAFERTLGFNPGAFNKGFSAKTKNKKRSSKPAQFSLKLMNEGFMDKVCEESKDAQTDLEDLRWKVNYLVDRDGKTPNTTHRFLQKGNTIILNLNHPEILKLLKLSKRSGNLAGHWAMAICLSENNSILKHLTPEAREDLMIIDAMSRCGKPDSSDRDHEENKPYDTNKDFDFERNHIDLWF